MQFLKRLDKNISLSFCHIKRLENSSLTGHYERLRSAVRVPPEHLGHHALGGRVEGDVSVSAAEFGGFTAFLGAVLVAVRGLPYGADMDAGVGGDAAVQVTQVVAQRGGGARQVRVKVKELGAGHTTLVMELMTRAIRPDVLSDLTKVTDRCPIHQLHLALTTGTRKIK